MSTLQNARRDYWLTIVLPSITDMLEGASEAQSDSSARDGGAAYATSRSGEPSTGATTSRSRLK